MGDDDSVVARLSIDGAEFWLSDESPEHHNYSPKSLGGITIRIILTVADPELFSRGRSRPEQKKSSPSETSIDGALAES